MEPQNRPQKGFLLHELKQSMKDMALLYFSWERAHWATQDFSLCHSVHPWMTTKVLQVLIWGLLILVKGKGQSDGDYSLEPGKGKSI